MLTTEELEVSYHYREAELKQQHSMLKCLPLSHTINGTVRILLCSWAQSIKQDPHHRCLRFEQ